MKELLDMSSKITTKEPSKKKKTNHRKLAALRAVAKKFDDEDSPEEKEPETESIFRKHLKRLNKLEEKGVQGEAYDLAALKSMRTLVLDLIPVAEDNYRKFPIHTAAAALNHYINQEREIMNDIRALEDFRSRAALLSKIIDKEMQGLAKIFIEHCTKLMVALPEQDAKNQAESLKRFMKTFGRELQASNEGMGDKMMEFLVADGKK